ncbi:regulatory protein RecX [Cohnella lubricantis]|uniref:Regulatory protein RecX n=1 Tax=Cohnella lubricantis TaxID=2163172 RepID=A0A841THP1_9BACL|nr:regulatory protein RecX [Cohnella lubricantis]MBB6677981.1 regulatory protein RecX [Cohnella lubricantis]MBP2120558.1 regulatory protein [Cohnella lubricantis]
MDKRWNEKEPSASREEPSKPITQGEMAVIDENPNSGAVVTGLEADSKRASMYRVALAPESGGASELLTVHEDTLINMRLLKGRRLSAEEWDELRKSEEVEQAYRASLGLLNRKARTRKELEEALKRKAFSHEAIAACLDRLNIHRLINDTEYAVRYADQKVTYQRKGSRLVKQELLRRGVGKNDVERALSSLDAETEQASAVALARKRWPSVKGATQREREYKLMAVLQRRGFPPQMARDAVRQAVSEAGEETSGSGGEWDEPFDPLLD